MKLTHRHIFCGFLLCLMSLCQAGTKASKLATLETQSWQAQQQQQTKRLSKLVEKQFEILYQLPKADLVRVTKPYLSAKTEFASDQHEQATVLPKLISSYRELKQINQQAWDATRVAKAEFELWQSQSNSATKTAELATRQQQLYQLLYPTHSLPQLKKAAYLKTVAADYRDQLQAMAEPTSKQDWQHISLLLRLAYQALLA